MQKPGFYIDLAANDPILRSNTFFFDTCLSWAGLCIEAMPRHHERLREHRNCEVIPKCISSTSAPMYFREKGRVGGAAAVVSKTDVAGDEELHRIECTLLDTVLKDREISHVDVLQLDIEGHEMPAISSVNFNKTTIDIIILEKNPAVEEHLISRFGYRKITDQNLGKDVVLLRPGFELLIGKGVVPYSKKRAKGRAQNDMFGLPVVCQSWSVLTDVGGCSR